MRGEKRLVNLRGNYEPSTSLPQSYRNRARAYRKVTRTFAKNTKVPTRVTKPNRTTRGHLPDLSALVVV